MFTMETNGTAVGDGVDMNRFNLKYSREGGGSE